MPTATGFSPGFRSIGISPSYTPVSLDTGVGLTAWPGNQWPAVNPMVTNEEGDGPAPLEEIYKAIPPSNAKFDVDNWSPENFASAFMATNPGLVPSPESKDDTYVDVQSVLDAADVSEELKELTELMQYRGAALDEGLTQSAVFEDYFRGILTYNRYTHPATTRLMAVCLAAATSTAMRFKWYFQRPRPSQLSPALMPPIDPPQHGSFPSGHSTQAHTLAHMFEEILGKLVQTTHTALEDGSKINRSPYRDMATRIARNREVLGLHYRSDSEAGAKLAEALFKNLKSNVAFKAELLAAQKEWGTK